MRTMTGVARINSLDGVEMTPSSPSNIKLEERNFDGEAPHSPLSPTSSIKKRSMSASPSSPKRSPIRRRSFSLSPKKIFKNFRYSVGLFEDELRKVVGKLLPPPGSVRASALVLVKAALGTGILALPSDSKEVGAGYMTGGLVFGAAVNILSLNMLGEACIKSDSWSFEALSETLLPGKWGYGMAVLSAAMMLLNCAGSMVAYCIIIAEILNILITNRQGETILFEGFIHAKPGGTKWGEFIMPFLVIFILLPLSLSPRIGMLRYLAVGGVLAMVFLIITFAYIVGRYGVDPTVKNAGTIFEFHDNPDVYAFINAISTVTFAYSNQFNMPQVAAELARSSMRRVSMVSMRATLIAGGCFFASVVLGLLAFGVGENQGADIVVDFREFTSGSGKSGKAYHRDVMSWIAMVGTLLSVMVCYNFHVFPIRQTGRWVVAQIRGKDEDEPDDKDERFCGIGFLGVARFWDLAIGAFAVVSMLIISLVWQNFMQVIHFVGSICASYLAYIAPPIFVLMARRRSDDNFSWFQLRNLPPMIIFVFGLFLCIAGTISAIVNP